jgi:hypothetical protein
VVLSAMFLATGCASAAYPVRNDSAASPLEGLWELCLRLEEGGIQPPKTETAVGYISLTQAAPHGGSSMNLGQLSHYGIYTADLGSLGIERDPRIPVPLVRARSDRDSAYIVLDPFGSHGSIVLAGHASYGRISGSWYHHAYVEGARGAFFMRKLEAERLPLPYRVGGPLSPPAIAGCQQSKATTGSNLDATGGMVDLGNHETNRLGAQDNPYHGDSEEMLQPDARVRTWNRLWSLRNWIRRYLAEHGTLPNELHDVLPRLGGTSFLTDGWGNLILYTRSASSYELRSAGTDRTAGTLDDMIATADSLPPRPDAQSADPGGPQTNTRV